MKIFQNLIAILMLIACSSGCKKEIHDKQPLVGKVLLINSNTPVDRALVRFVRVESTGLFNPYIYHIHQEVITDSDGTFIIPDSTTAEYVQAWGLDSVFGGNPSNEEYIQQYISNEGGVVKLYLRPPAWLRVVPIDTEPLNPEITSVQVNYNPSVWPEGWAETLNTGFVWENQGNVPISIAFRLYNNSTDAFEYINQSLPALAPFDTTTFEFSY